jgi:hypothetical protein
MANVTLLQYLPRHMLLVGASSLYSTMQYIDISTGEELGVKPPSVMKDPTTCLKQNPCNGTVATCDLRGVVKVWSPAVIDPLLQLKAHKGAIHDIAFHDSGRFFITVGGDHKLKVWDCRALRVLEELSVSYAFDTIDISSSGLVAMGGEATVQIWKDMFRSAKPTAPHMKFHLGYGNIAHRVRFCPFEDVLGIGHSKGFQSLIIPGSGEANPDFYYANPHETERHRKERVVTTLLDKLPPDTISLDLQIAGVNQERLEEYEKNLQANRRARNIRAKKQRRVDRSLGNAAPSGIGHAGNDDEIDEELGFKEQAPVKLLKSKKEILSEKKKLKWDKKDSADKVRSKQTMRHSRIVQKKRLKKFRLEKNNRKNAQEERAEMTITAPKKTLGNGRTGHREEAVDVEAPARKRPRQEALSKHNDSMKGNAALRRFLGE